LSFADSWGADSDGEEPVPFCHELLGQRTCFSRCERKAIICNPADMNTAGSTAARRTTRMATVRVQTRSEVQTILHKANLRPSKRLGQHFLVDGNLMRKVAATAGVTDRDTVLEVGGGTGGLSDLLVQQARRVVIVEVSQPLAKLLRQRFADHADRVEIVCADVLEGKHTVSPHVLRALTREPPVGEALLVANLPYHVATPLLINLVLHVPLIKRFCFTVQSEVADRLLASAGGKAFGPLAIITQAMCELTRACRLPPAVFWPMPEVDSSLVLMTRRPEPLVPTAQLKRFADLVRAAFAHRRKTLRYNLLRSLTPGELSAAETAIDLSRRAETVTMSEWVRLTQVISSASNTVA